MFNQSPSLSVARTAGFIRCDYLVIIYCSCHFYTPLSQNSKNLSFKNNIGWTNRPTDKHFDIILELSLTISWSMSSEHGTGFSLLENNMGWTDKLFCVCQIVRTS